MEGNDTMEDVVHPCRGVCGMSSMTERGNAAATTRHVCEHAWWSCFLNRYQPLFETQVKAARLRPLLCAEIAAKEQVNCIWVCTEGLQNLQAYAHPPSRVSPPLLVPNHLHCGPRWHQLEFWA